MTAPRTITLVSGDCQLDLQPHIGAAISRLHWQGIDVLRKTPQAAVSTSTVRQMCCYPLVPYSNRIGNGKLVVRDKTYQLRPNFPTEPHAIHGVGWQRAWQINSENKQLAVLAYKHTPDADWPFAFEAEQTVSITNNAVALAIRATNLDTQPMPVGLGFHPFFPIDTATSLQSDWTGVWVMGEDKLPTELVPTPTNANFSQARGVFDWKVDNCFVGWSRRAVLTYATHRTIVTASSACNNIVCFAPSDGRNFLALEPVSNINNAFALAAKGVANTGTRLIGRGDSFDISMTITVDPA
ncbi:MAG: aldose 1-epimerase [Rhodocyclaceae bacterium]|nr:aldose 1-epimerase [Rhodocyclaceae bacterium]